MLAAITVLFFSLLALRSWKDLSFCAVCVSFTAVWVGLYSAYWLNVFDSLLLVVLMAGMTLHGIYGVWESKISDRFRVFRLPFLLTGLTVFYMMFAIDFRLEKIAFLLALWLFFSVLYLYRESEAFGAYIDEMVGCCKDW